ncbi:MAG: hypothetical protein IT162_13105 [Bryobacterales bacterium]|nr:hypothetical protein [Bryobacterales bacterium]
MSYRTAAVAVLGCCLWAHGQTPPAEKPKPAGSGEAGGVFRLPSAFPDEAAPPKPAAAKEEGPKPVVLENAGKPMRVPFACTDQDISTFGMACTADEPCAIFLELTSVHGLNGRIYLAGNLHSESTTLYSVLLVSEDNGKTFGEPAARIPAAGLERFQFADNDTGWVSGVLQQSLPRDPFFLLTTDAGKTWRQRPVFADGGIGSVEQYTFDSKTAGVIVIDRGAGAEGGSRYERHETMTGGDSWMVREVSARPLKIKAAAPPAADWRLQGDGKLKAHSVERRVGERWERVAAFDVSAGVCRPESTELTEPPPAAAEEPAAAPGPAVAPRRGQSRPPTLKKP